MKGFPTMQPWPNSDPAKTVDAQVTIAVQVGGKLKSTVEMPLSSREEDILDVVRKEPKITRMLEDQEIVKAILVPKKRMNLIMKPKG